MVASKNRRTVHLSRRPEVLLQEARPQPRKPTTEGDEDEETSRKHGSRADDRRPAGSTAGHRRSCRRQAPAGELFLPSTVPDALYASELIGMDVYSSATDYAAEYGDRAVEPDVRSQWDDIGEINDIVLSPAGDIQACWSTSAAFSASAPARWRST